MILGVDHVALSCEDVHAASRKLGSAGYRVIFAQQDVPNSPAKRPFLQTYHPLHSLAYCEAEIGTPVELTQHSGPLEDAHSPYQVLLAAAPPEAVPLAGAELPWAPVWREALGCRQPQAVLWPTLQAQFWHDGASSGSGLASVRAVLLPVADVARAEDFWRTGLGCDLVAAGTVQTGRRWARVAFRAPISKWSLDVILVEGRRSIYAPLLDAAGFSCLALLSTSLDRDSGRVWQAGAHQSTGAFHVRINGNLLRVAVFRGPDDELIELIEIRRSHE